ncbi:MAG TPA: alpha/beta hydrolase [Acidimicrobiales bacterium]|nr:alpha/beta hydrolase [Acidimicrobiales bacterium]
MKRTVALVHGAWHGAWCWEWVVPLLAARGIEAVAIDLPGHGRDPGVLGDLNQDAARVHEMLDRLGGGVVLVGHSYGGAVITQAGNHGAVAHLVYLAAFPLQMDESCASTAAHEPEARHITYEGRPNVGSGFVVGPNGTITLDPVVAAECLYNRCDPDLVRWAVAQLGPQPLITFQQSPTTEAWRSKASTYAVCADDMVVHPDLQRILARRCGSVVEWPTDHSPFLSRPELVADLLTALATDPG